MRLGTVSEKVTWDSTKLRGCIRTFLQSLADNSEKFHPLQFFLNLNSPLLSWSLHTKRKPDRRNRGHYTNFQCRLANNYCSCVADLMLYKLRNDWKSWYVWKPRDVFQNMRQAELEEERKKHIEAEEVSFFFRKANLSRKSNLTKPFRSSFLFPFVFVFNNNHSEKN